jgi:hypothetical protein
MAWGGFPLYVAAAGLRLEEIAWMAAAYPAHDLGYAVGALLAGVTADALGADVAIWLVAALTGVFGVVAAVRMTETRAPKSGMPVAAPTANGDEITAEELEAPARAGPAAPRVGRSVARGVLGGPRGWGSERTPR